jgi:hypothetical protein
MKALALALALAGGWRASLQIGRPTDSPDLVGARS